jgi:two-component system response regulator WspF
MNVGLITRRPVVIEVLQQVVRSRKADRVIWIVDTGDRALERCAVAPPEVIVLDAEAALSDVAPLTQRIMAAVSCAVLIVTSSLNGQAAEVFDAMGAGALDVIALPTEIAPPSLEPWFRKLETISRLLHVPPELVPAGADPGLLVAIGASAGGPAAVASILAALPGSFPAAILIVQHLGEGFASGMRDWLGQRSALPVGLARERDQLLPGRVLLAGTGDHLVLKSPRIVGYTEEPSEAHYRPSVDVLFRSITRFHAGEAVGVILSGMGRDGALGLLALRASGHHTIAQDRTSSAVYGMPKAAVEIGAAAEVLPLASIPERLVALLAE